MTKHNSCSFKARKNGIRFRKEKKAYATRAEAEANARGIQQTYFCPHCSRWHNGRHSLYRLPASVLLSKEYTTLRIELGPRAFTHFIAHDSEAKIHRLFEVKSRRQTQRINLNRQVRRDPEADGGRSAATLA